MKRPLTRSEEEARGGATGLVFMFEARYECTRERGLAQAIIWREEAREQHIPKLHRAELKLAADMITEKAAFWPPDNSEEAQKFRAAVGLEGETT